MTTPSPPRYNHRHETLPLDPLTHSPTKEEAELDTSKLVNTFYRNRNEWLLEMLQIQEVIDQPANEFLEDRIIFLSSVDAKLFDTPLPKDSKHLQHNLSRSFQIPKLFWSPIMNEVTGCFGDNLNLGSIDDPASYSTWFRFMIKQVDDFKAGINIANAPITYKWDKIAVYTIFRKERLLILCFDIPQSAQEDIQEQLNDKRGQIVDPYELHPIIIKSVLGLFDNSVWSLRHLIRRYENARSNYNSMIQPEPHFDQLHDISRHVIHSCETLRSAMNILQRIIEQHDILISELPPPTSATKPLSETLTLLQIPADSGSSSLTESLLQHRSKQREVTAALKFHMTILNGIELRAKALEERLKNEINLAFNVVALYNSQTSVHMSKASLEESASVRTISVLGLIFLPGTFICSVFSTTFFNFSPASDGDPQHWTMSDKFWLFWVVAIPVTIATVLCWVLWMKYAKGKVKRV